MSETPRGENLENHGEHLRNVDLYDLMEGISTFQGDTLFGPVYDSLHRIPAGESMSVEERFESFNEANKKLLAGIGLSLEIFIDKEEIDRGVDEVKDATIHVFSPDQFVKYLKSVDGMSINPYQVVGLKDLVFKLRWNLMSHYNIKKPNKETFNYFKVLPDIGSELERIYEETKSNKYREHSGAFYFAEEPEKEGETPNWHLGEDFQWSDIEEESIRAQELTDAVRGKYLREYLLAYDAKLAPSDISEKNLFEYDATIDLIRNVSKNPNARGFVENLINLCREQISKMRDHASILPKAEKEKLSFDIDEFSKSLDEIEKELNKQ